MRSSMRHCVLAVAFGACGLLGAPAALATAASADAAGRAIPRPSGTRSVAPLRSEETAFSSSWLTRDGRQVTRVSSAPVRWKDRSGTWRAFDLNLRRSRSGTRDIASVADAQVALPTTESGSREIVVSDGRGAKVRMALEGARARRAVRTKSNVREWRDVLPGVTQRATVTQSGVKEELVLDGPEAPRRFSYRLELSRGLVPSVSDAGDVVVRRGTTVVFTIPRGSMREGDDSGRSVPLEKYGMTRGAAPGQWRLVVDAEGRWLRAAMRKWPVVVDPTVVIYPLAAASVCRTIPIDMESIFDERCDPTTPVGATARIGYESRPCSPSGCIDPFAGMDALAVRGFVLPASVNPVDISQARLRLTTVDQLYAAPRISVRGTSDPFAGGSFWAFQELADIGPVPGSIDVNVTAEVRRWLGPGPVARGGWGFHLSGMGPAPPGGEDENWVSIATHLYPETAKRPYLDVYSAGPAQAGSEVEAPAEGKLTSRFVELRAKATSEHVTTASFEYVAGGSRDWKPVPLGALRFKATGAQPTSAEIDVTDGRSTRLIWDLNKTPGGDVDGPIHVRALLDAGEAGGGGVTPERNFRLDRKNPETSSQQDVGPASVDLLTGDVAVTESDADVKAFLDDLSLSRTYHSRGGTPRMNDMFGPGWTSGFEADGGEMPFRGIYNFTEVEEEQEIVDWSVTTNADCDEGADDEADSEDYDLESYDCDDISVEPVWETTRFETEYAVLEMADGSKVSFFREGSVWILDEGSADLKVEKTSSGFKVRDAQGGETEFEPDSAGSPNYRPVTYNEAGSSKDTTFQYATVGGRKRLSRIMAPALAGVSCSGSSWTAGCRALELQWGTISVDGKDHSRVMAVKLRAVDPSGQVPGDSHTIATYEYDSSGRLKKVSDPRTSTGLPVQYEYDSEGRLSKYTPPGEKPWTFAYQAITGDAGNGRVRSITRKNPAGTDATTTFVYDVPLSGSGAPRDLSPSAVATWGQTDRPLTATAVFPPDAVPSGSGMPSSWTRATVNYLGVHGKTVNVADPEGNITTAEYDQNGNTIRELTARNRERALAASGSTAARSQVLDSQYVYAPNGVDLLSQMGPEHEIRQANGTLTNARQYKTMSYDQGKPTSFSGDQHLVTEARQGAYRTSDSHVIDERVTRYAYSNSGSDRGWEVKEPLKTTVGEGTEAATTTYWYHPSYPLLMEKWMPKASGSDSHAMRYMYSGISGAEWCDSATWLPVPAAAGGSLCIALPVEQPASGQNPGKWFRYSLLWDPVQQLMSDGIHPASRTTTIERDALGRETKRITSSSTGRAIPDVTSVYDANTGRPTTTTSAAIGSDPARTVTRVWDDNGRLASYTDADSGQTSYEYDLNGRQTKATDSRGSRTVAYDERDEVSGVTDSTLAGIITATRDADGALVEEVLPGNLKLTRTVNENGDPVAQKWERTTGCSGSACTWASSTATRDALGRFATSTSEKSSSTYRYDTLGRLSGTDEQRGTVCKARGYAFDKNSNRTSLTTRTSGSGGACGTGTSTSKSNTLDGADRLRNSGYAYDDLGRTTTVPASDSPDGNAITLTYDTDDLVASIEAGPAKQTLTRDPLRRLRSDASQNTGLSLTTSVLRYADDQDAPTARTGSWGWERYIADADGTQLATSTDGGTATWELTGLHGDVVATAPTTATVPSTGTEYDEFGASADTTGTLAPKGLRHGWLGGYGKHTAFTPGGLIHMGARVYNPVSGRFLQVDPIEGGSANAYDYCGQDPANCVDLDGRMSLSLKKLWKKVKKAGGSIARRAAKLAVKRAPFICYAYHKYRDLSQNFQKRFDDRWSDPYGGWMTTKTWDQIIDEMYMVNKCFNPFEWVF